MAFFRDFLKTIELPMVIRVFVELYLQPFPFL